MRDEKLKEKKGKKNKGGYQRGKKKEQHKVKREEDLKEKGSAGGRLGKKNNEREK